MRVIIILAFILQVSQSTGQEVADKFIITIDDAIKMALQNNPDTLSISDGKKLTGDIKSAWYQWIFQIHKFKTLQEYRYLLGDLGRIAALRYQAGDVELLEKSTFITKLADVNAAAAISANETEITGNLLKQLLFTAYEIAPADTTLAIYQVDKGFNDDPYLPAQPDTNVPADTLLTRYQLFSKAISIENKKLELDNLFIRLQFYYTTGLPHAGTILQTSKAKFDAEEIDYLEFTEKITEAFMINLQYLETLNNYNQTAIYLECHAY